MELSDDLTAELPLQPPTAASRLFATADDGAGGGAFLDPGHAHAHSHLPPPPLQSVCSPKGIPSMHGAFGGGGHGASAGADGADAMDSGFSAALAFDAGGGAGTRALCLIAGDVFALALSAYELAKLAEPPHTFRLPMDGPEWHTLREDRLPPMSSPLFSAKYEAAVKLCLAPAPLTARPGAHDFLQLFSTNRAAGDSQLQAEAISAQVDALTATATATATAEAAKIQVSAPTAADSVVAAQAAEIARLAARVAELEGALSR